MPLIYNSLDSDHPPIQEKALEGVPKLCGALDYGTVENVLLVKVAVSGWPLVYLLIIYSEVGGNFHRR